MANDSSGVPYSKIVETTPDEFATFILKKSVFISCFEAFGSVARAGHFREIDLASTAFQNSLRVLIPTPERSEVKVIGPEAGCKKVVEMLKTHGVRNYRIAFREDDTRILFYPTTGRVRVENNASTLNATIAVEKPFTPKLVTPKAVVRVLIVDDSKTIRVLLESIFKRDPSFEIVGSTGKPLEVMGLIEKHRPDVITMDIQMPDIDGVTLVKDVMKRRPTPTVMITSASIEDGPSVLAALENGAVDYIQKPSFDELERIIPVIIEKVKGAAKANITKAEPDLVAPVAPAASTKLNQKTLIAIGSSTGGTEALQVLLTGLPREIPPIVIVQHIPPVFSDAFARRLGTLCPFEVKEAEDGDIVQAGRVLIAPGGKQMAIKTLGEKTYVVISEDAPVNRHRPSVDFLFNSIVVRYRGPVIGVILTGMGADGAKGLLGLKNKGSYTIAQSEKSCVVFGMPREAIELGAAEDVIDLRHIASALIKKLSSKRAA